MAVEEPIDGPYVDDLKKLATWLQTTRPANILMPLVADKKQPMFKHKDGKWSWHAYAEHDMQPHSPVGILLQDLICLDFDTKEMYVAFKHDHPQWFHGPPIEEGTKKGCHIIWARTPLCDELELHDGARCLDPDCVAEHLLDCHGEVPIDIKTRTSTGTAGVLVVAPSDGKKWIHAPWENSLQAVPDSLVKWICNNKKKVTPPKTDTHQGKDAANGQCGKWSVPLDLSKAVALANEVLLSLNDTTSSYYEQNGNALYYKTGPARCCPYGRGADGDPHDKNNFALRFWLDGSLVYFCHGANCKPQYKVSPKIVGNWRNGHVGSSSFTNPRFDEAWFGSMTQPWDAEMNLPPHKRDKAKLAELAAPPMNYLNRYFMVVKSSKPEIVQLLYDRDGQKIVNFTRRRVDEHWRLYPSRFMRHYWYANGERRQVDRLVFEVDMNKVKSTEFNMFLGLKVERENDVAGTELDMTKISHVLELIKDVYSGGSNEVYNYILDWFAYPLQTKRKTGVCIVVISPQGYGKGSVIHDLVGCGIYGEVMDGTEGGCYTQITDIDDIVGKFNALSCGRLFINADECSSFGGAYKQNNKFKSIITASTRTLERKGLDAVPISDHTNYFLSTNTCEPVKVEPSERRFLILEVPYENKKSRQFFSELHQQIASDNAALHFYKFLLSRDLDAFHPSDSRPITSAAKEMMAYQVPAPIQFIKECAEQKMLQFAETSKDDHGCDRISAWKHDWTTAQKVITSTLYEGFVQYARKKKLDTPDDARFSKAVIKSAGLKPGKDNGVRKLILPAPEVVEQTLRAYGLWFE